MDGTEVEVSSAMWNAADNVRDTKALGSNALGDFTRYLNPYSLLTTQGTYDGERATSNKRVFTLTRSAWAGAQRTAAASWSGDIFASWKTFKQQIAGGVDVTVTGNPYWTNDTGGFFVSDFPGGEQNPAWRELYRALAAILGVQPDHADPRHRRRARALPLQDARPASLCIRCSTARDCAIACCPISTD